MLSTHCYCYHLFLLSTDNIIKIYCIKRLCWNLEWPDYDENKCSTTHIMSKCYDWSKFYDDEITEDNVDVYCDNKPDLTNFEQERCDRLYDMLGR
jgi:hypothetical protein